MKAMMVLVSWLLFVALSVLAVEVYRGEAKVRAIDADRVVLNHISYGLFNIDEWKGIVADVVTKKIEGFEVTPSNRAEVHRKAEEVLHAVINEIEYLMRERNRNTLSGVFKQFFTDLLFSFDDLRADVPRFATIIVNRLDEPETKAALKEWIIAKINTFADETVGEMDYTAMNEVFDRNGCSDRESCAAALAAYRHDARASNRTTTTLLSVCILALLVLMVVTNDRGSFMAFCSAALTLLAAGVALPMIDIEATITHFSFTLLGEPVGFDDQVIFYQSKSIIEVVGLLLQNGDAALVVVSVLILSFSVLLPLVKLLLSFYAAATQRLPRGRVATFFMFRSAKWSMADVMVVALFMAYIGFSGVINNQLTQIERGDASLEVFTTNNSTLRLGFYLFTAYAISGLLLSERLLRLLGKPGDGLTKAAAAEGR